MLVMTLVNCRPTMPPPKILGCRPTSCAARSMPTESGGYDATNTMSALVGLDGPDDRRVIDGAGRVGPVVDGLEPELLDQLARADERVLRVLGVGADDRDGLRPRSLLRQIGRASCRERV